jgi:hypothetical protein
MRGATVIVMTTLALCSSISGAQSALNPPLSATPPSAEAPSDAGLKDLDAMTFACPRAALDAAARAASKVQSLGTYQFSFFRIVNLSHHAQFEVHFQSNYPGEPDLKYCVVLYCQQGWDPAHSPTVTLLDAAHASIAVTSHAESCEADHRATRAHPKTAPH